MACESVLKNKNNIVKPVAASQKSKISKNDGEKTNFEDSMKIVYKIFFIVYNNFIYNR